MDAKVVWSKIFGHTVESFTIRGKKYTVNMTDGGWECTCKDFEIRHGSYLITVYFPKGETNQLEGCKHIHKVLVDKKNEVNSPIIDVRMEKRDGS